jgi:hypothetical protein
MGFHTGASEQDSWSDLIFAIICVLSYIKATAVTREDEGQKAVGEDVSGK